MKQIAVYTILVISLSACTKSQESQLEEIRAFEQSDKVKTDEGLKELTKMHNDYGMKFSDAEANNYLYAAGQYYFYENNPGEAIPCLTEYITRDDTSDRYRNAAINLAILHGNTNDYAKADELISEILDNDLPTAAQWQDIIKLYNEKVKANENVKPTDYERLAMAYTAVGVFPKAVASLDTAIANFKDYEKRADLIYRAGFIGWEYLKDTEVATKYYTTFLAEYPNDAKAAEVKNILKSGMLEMSNEAILEMLKGK